MGGTILITLSILTLICIVDYYRYRDYYYSDGLTKAKREYNSLGKVLKPLFYLTHYQRTVTLMVCAIGLVITSVVMHYQSNAADTRDPSKMFFNVRAVVISKDGYSERSGKQDVHGKVLFIRMVEDTTLYTELNGHNWKALDGDAGNRLFYSKQAGDTLYFQRIARRFFHIQRPVVRDTGKTSGIDAVPFMWAGEMAMAESRADMYLRAGKTLDVLAMTK